MLAASRARPYLRAVRLGGLTTGTKGQRPLLRYFCALWAAYDRNRHEKCFFHISDSQNNSTHDRPQYDTSCDVSE
ncbi:hypothetical protein TNIN_492611 [Trichonephila inaurata madagascariensis]|uniref:Uncharacterized protein n=1 Tax=Trichonephila inaurata madagascariensis TaxID=2747483 RepID=A0A8X6WY58_9ARAC|nr:hypothetical protein TNIN_492611 [Trichonephila inaurata madagascariensis]